MLVCVRHMPDPSVPGVTRPLRGPGAAQDDVQEPTTIIQLRDRIYHLHMDFFFNAVLSPQTGAA